MVKNGICYMCTESCPTKVHVEAGRATKIEMVEKESIACPRWRAQLDFIYHPDRLLHPLKREGERGNGSFKRISWDEALDTAAARLKKMKAEYGPESVVFWIAHTKEPRPYYHRLTHAFGSPNYCTESSNCFSSTIVADMLTFGRGYGSLCANRFVIDESTRCMLIWGSSVKNSDPLHWKNLLQKRKKGLKLIVIDPRRTNIAALADIHLQLRPGTDGALALGLLNVIITESLCDETFVEKWTIGFEDLKSLVKAYPPDKVEKITKVSAEKIIEAARTYAEMKPAKIGMSSIGITHCTNGVQNYRAVTMLPVLTGNLDVLGGNERGSRALTRADITLHERIREMPPGLGADRFPIWTGQCREMHSNTLRGRIESGSPYPIKGLFGAGLNIMYFANSNRFVEALKKLETVIVTDYFHSPSTPFADIVLPIASWIERPILVFSKGKHVKFIKPSIEPVGESWPESKIFIKLAERLDLNDDFWDGDFEKCLDSILAPSGISLKELKQHPEGMTFPLSPGSEKQNEKKGFQTPSGKVEIASSILAQYGHEPLPVYQEPAESPVSRPDLAADFPLVLTSGARNICYTHSMHRNIQRLRKLNPTPMLEIHPGDAELQEIRDGDQVTVRSPRGRIKMKAHVTDKILPGVIHVPHHWPGEANVNILIDDQQLDPISGFAPFKSQLCQVSKH